MSDSPPATAFLNTLPRLTVTGNVNDLRPPELSGTACESCAIGDYKIEDTIKNTNTIEDEEHAWEHDPVNPRNWSPAKKWIAITLVSIYTLITPLGSTIMAPGLPDIATRYNITNPSVTGMTLSIFFLSFAIGPLFLAPLSEMYGRVWVLHIANLCFLMFNLGCALSPNIVSFIIFRCLAGLSGSASIACGGGVVADLFVERERASAMALYSIGPLISPCLGPVIGGYVAESVGIFYVFYVIVGISGATAVLAISFLRETYAPVIRLRRNKSATDPEVSATQYSARTPQGMGTWTYLWINLNRPILLLTRSFICFILSLYMALIYGISYLMLSTFPTLFSDVYHFNSGTVGLTYNGLGAGFIFATVFGTKFCDKIYIYLATKNGGVGKPEMRVPTLIFGSFFIPIGILWYGWSAQEHIHFIMPIIGTAIFGFGMVVNFLAIQLYLLDTFVYAASALGAAFVLRSFFAFAFPLFGAQIFDKFHYGGGNSLLAGIAIIVGIPFPFWIYYYGERMRARSAYTH